MNAYTVHIPAQAVQVGDHLRQRCAWCGITLLDYDLARVASPREKCDECGGSGWMNRQPGYEYEPDGVPCVCDGGWKRWEGPATWGPGSLVATTDGGGISYVVEHQDGDRLPPNACAQIDHEVTR